MSSISLENDMKKADTEADINSKTLIALLQEKNNELLTLWYCTEHARQTLQQENDEFRSLFCQTNNETILLSTSTGSNSSSSSSSSSSSQSAQDLTTSSSSTSTSTSIHSSSSTHVSLPSYTTSLLFLGQQKDSQSNISSNVPHLQQLFGRIRSLEQQLTTKQVQCRSQIALLQQNIEKEKYFLLERKLLEIEIERLSMEVVYRSTRCCEDCLERKQISREDRHQKQRKGKENKHLGISKETGNGKDNFMVYHKNTSNEKENEEIFDVIRAKQVTLFIKDTDHNSIKKDFIGKKNDSILIYPIAPIQAVTTTNQCHYDLPIRQRNIDSNLIRPCTYYIISYDNTDISSDESDDELNDNDMDLFPTSLTYSSNSITSSTAIEHHYPPSSFTHSDSQAPSTSTSTRNPIILITTSFYQQLEEQLQMQTEDIMSQSLRRLQLQQQFTTTQQTLQQTLTQLNELQFEYLRLQTITNYWEQKVHSITKELKFRLRSVIPLEVRLEQTMQKLEEVSKERSAFKDAMTYVCSLLPDRSDTMTATTVTSTSTPDALYTTSTAIRTEGRRYPQGNYWYDNNNNQEETIDNSRHSSNLTCSVSSLLFRSK